MGKELSILKNKTALKYFLATLILSLIVSTFYLVRSYRNNIQEKSTIKDNSAEIKRLTIIADRYYDELEQYETSYYYFKKIISLCDPKVNTIDYIDALTSISYIQLSAGDYNSAEANATKALPYLKYMKKTRYAANIYNLLGIIYSDTYDYDNAIFYYKKTVHLKTSAWRKSGALNNIGTVYMAQKKYKEAAQLFSILSSKNYFPKNLSPNNLYYKTYYLDYARIIDNLGFCLYKLGNTKGAIACSNKGLKIRLMIKNHEGLAINYNHLARYYLKTNPKLAKNFAKKAYKEGFFDKVSSQINSLELLIDCSKGNDLKKYTLNYIKLTNNNTTIQKKAKNQYARIRYDSNKDKDENLELKAQKIENELQLERQKNRNFISYIIIIVAASIVLFLYFHLSLKGKKQKKEAIYNSEMRISKKLHDELANDVFTTMAFIENKNISLEENKEHLLKNLDTIYSRTRDISKENSTIITDKNYVIALKEMISGFKTPNLNIILNGTDTISWDEIEKTKKIILYRVLQELFSNMKKHSSATLVSINFKMTEKKITVIYNDNGVGTKNKAPILKNGLQNVENRIKTINGNIIFENNSEKSFRLSFSFPL